eukprot:5876545-Prymnesium_polylepis.2
MKTPPAVRPSPLTNRVTPFGAIVAHPARYAESSVVFGNRGTLHDGHYRVRKEFVTTAWLACKLRVSRTRAVQRDDNRAFNGRKRVLQSPGHYTELVCDARAREGPFFSRRGVC